MIINPVDIVVTEDRQFRETTSGAIIIKPGATLVLDGAHNGSIHIEPGGVLAIHGKHNGSLHIASGALATVGGDQMGSVHVASGGTFALSSRGRHGGSIHNFGQYVNEGIRGGTVSGIRPDDRPGGRVRQPDKVVDGASYYNW